MILVGCIDLIAIPIAVDFHSTEDCRVQEDKWQKIDENT